MASDKKIVKVELSNGNYSINGNILEVVDVQLSKQLNAYYTKRAVEQKSKDIETIIESFADYFPELGINGDNATINLDVTKESNVMWFALYVTGSMYKEANLKNKTSKVLRITLDTGRFIDIVVNRGISDVNMDDVITLSDANIFSIYILNKYSEFLYNKYEKAPMSVLARVTATDEIVKLIGSGNLVKGSKMMNIATCSRPERLAKSVDFDGELSVAVLLIQTYVRGSAAPSLLSQTITQKRVRRITNKVNGFNMAKCINYGKMLKSGSLFGKEQIDEFVRNINA